MFDIREAAPSNTLVGNDNRITSRSDARVTYNDISRTLFIVAPVSIILCLLMLSTDAPTAALLAVGALGLALPAGVFAFRHEDWAIVITSGYLAVAFSIRPLYLLSNPTALHANVAVSVDAFDSSLATAISLSLLGYGGVLFGYYGLARPFMRKMRPREIVGLRASGLLIANAASLAGGLLLIHSAGGASTAIASLKTVKTSLEGNLYPLALVWIGQAACLIWIQCQKMDKSRLYPTLAYGGIAWGTAVDILIGSRGDALPALVATIVIVGSRQRKHLRHVQRRWNLRVIVSLVVLSSALIVYGAIKEYSAPVRSGTFDLSTAVSNITTVELYAQTSEVDYFALSISLRSELPSGLALATRAAEAPLLLLPSRVGITKPEPYDYSIREAFLGGTVQTGLPASVFGELWLIGGSLAIALLTPFLGIFFRRNKYVAKFNMLSIWSAVIVGQAYLLLSRPLDISVSHLIGFGIALMIASVLVTHRSFRSKA